MAFRAVCFVARLAKGSGHWLHLASRIPSREAAVAIAWDLIRGSLAYPISHQEIKTGAEAPVDFNLNIFF